MNCPTTPDRGEERLFREEYPYQRESTGFLTLRILDFR
jgi:hypothetical protein